METKSIKKEPGTKKVMPDDMSGVPFREPC